jgi:hypothetical protein
MEGFGGYPVVLEVQGRIGIGIGIGRFLVECADWGH